MKKALIAFFSQTGSTKTIAEHIAKGLSDGGFEVSFIAISPKEMVPENMLNTDKFDIIGIGTPVYFFRPPYHVMEFVKQLKVLKGKPSFVFILHGTHPGNCGNKIRHELTKKGSRDLGYFKSNGADYWAGYVKRGVLFSPDSPAKAEKTAAEKFGQNLSSRLEETSPQIETLDGATPIIYKLQRMLVSKLSTKVFFSRTFGANNKCNNCGICIEKCPVGNITLKPNDKPRWHSECLLCTTCDLCCPEDAVYSALNWKVFAPIMASNIKRSIKEQVPYARVEHKNGVTIRKD